MEVFIALLLFIFAGPVAHYLFKIETEKAITTLVITAITAISGACYMAYKQDISWMYFCLDFAAFVSSVIYWCPSEENKS